MVTRLENGLVVAPQPIAVEEGVRILMAGGNAVDAAVATAFCQTVVDPQMCGIAGFGVAHVYLSGGEEKLINFYDRAPREARADMFMPIGGTLVTGDYFPVEGNLNQNGYLSVSTPGTLKGLWETHSRYGRLSWAEVLAPAIRHAREGVRVNAQVAAAFKLPGAQGNVDSLTKLRTTDACAAIYLKDGRTYNAGELLVNRDYADALELIARKGPDAIYDGELSSVIEDDFRKNGGILSAEDLRDFRVRVSDPIDGTYRGRVVRSSPPPGGGTMVIKILQILEGFDLPNVPHNGARYVHLVAEAMRITIADRAENWGDPEFIDLQIEKLLSKEHAAERRALIEERGPADVVGAAVGAGGRDTTHLNVVDREGNVVAMTHTLGMSSGVVTPGLGFMYNNAMHKFNPLPGTPNSIAPGKARSSALSPTIVFEGDRPIMAVGSPGAFGIMTGTTQAILNVLDHGMTAQEAVSAPRLHCENPTIRLEARFPSYVADQLRAMGHDVTHSANSYERMVGRVHLTLIDWDRGRVTGGADPRGSGMALSDEI